jgi:hypothetical protein
MNFTPERNPKIVALAQEAAQQINQLGEAHQRQIEEIYRDFRAKADAIHQEQDSTADMESPGAASLQTDQTI